VLLFSVGGYIVLLLFSVDCVLSACDYNNICIQTLTKENQKKICLHIDINRIGIVCILLGCMKDESMSVNLVHTYHENNTT